MSLFCFQPENSGIFLYSLKIVFHSIGVVSVCADELALRETTASLLPSETHISNIVFSRVHFLGFICISTFLYRFHSINIHKDI